MRDEELLQASKPYLSEWTYEQFAKHLKERHHPNRDIRMYANAQVAQTAQYLTNQMRATRAKDIDSTEKCTCISHDKENEKLLQAAKPYLSEWEYNQFAKHLKERHHPNRNIRMYANAEVSKTTRYLTNQMRAQRCKEHPSI